MIYPSIWGVHLQREASRALVSAEKSAHKSDVLAQRVADLEGALDRLLLVTRAVWELARDQAGLTEEALLQKIEEVDVRDGVKDGKLTEPAKRCPRCSRTMSKRHRRCLYCGVEDGENDPFDAVS
jgi:hypothetical protein